MNRFWDGVTAPVLRALQPRSILQIGDRDAAASLKLIEAATASGATVHLVSRAPVIDVEAQRRAAGDLLVVHPAGGLDVVPLLPAPDLALIDDDPNWYTVHGLLAALERQAGRTQRPFPVVLMTNVGWPHGRRDSYDDPAAIPEAYRLAHERAGVTPGASALTAQSGLFADRFHAAEEHQPRSGVLTALEDFVADRPDRFRVDILPMFHGLALLRPLDGPTAAKLGPVLASLQLGRSGALLAAELEAARVALAIENKALKEALDRAAYRNELLHAALRERQSSGAADTHDTHDTQDAAALARALLSRLRRAAAARLRGLMAGREMSAPGPNR